MKIFFRDKADGIWFEYHDTPPSRSTIRLGSNGKLNLAALHLYSLYRNAVYHSYRVKPDLADDIKTFPRVCERDNTSNPYYQEPVYHYAIAGSLGAMQEWIDPNKHMKCYMAYEKADGYNRRIGFVHFYTATVNEKPVVYIAQAGVLQTGEGIGRRLMECVLAHYPAGTEFYILTRLFNSEAKVLYQDRLGFSAIELHEIRQLGYDERYCGFKHITTTEEIANIKARQYDGITTAESITQTPSVRCTL